MFSGVIEREHWTEINELDEIFIFKAVHTNISVIT